MPTNSEHAATNPPEPGTPEYRGWAAEVVEELRAWVIENECVPDAELSLSKRRAMALLDTCDGVLREAGRWVV